MATINKSMLVKTVAQLTGHDTLTTLVIVDEFLRQIEEEYKNGHKVEIREFGTFFPYTRKPRIYKAFETKETKKMAKKKIMKFRCSRQLHL